MRYSADIALDGSWNVVDTSIQHTLVSRFHGSAEEAQLIAEALNNAEQRKHERAEGVIVLRDWHCSECGQHWSWLRGDESTTIVCSGCQTDHRPFVGRASWYDFSGTVSDTV